MRTALSAALLLLLLAAPAAAADRRVKALAKKTGISVELLEELKAERFFSRDVYERRAFIKDLAMKPRRELLPLVILIGMKEEDDEPIRRSAIRLYSHMGLLCDRSEIREQVLPAVQHALKLTKRGQDQRWAFEELVRLSEWFQMDADLFELCKPVFEGKDFNLRGFAFQAMCSLRHETIEQEYFLPACVQVYGSTKGYSLFDRFRAVDELAERDIARIGPLLREQMATGKDPKMQVKSFYVFCDWKDPSVLPLARDIDSTAVHKLRRAAFRARIACNDLSCLSDVGSWLAKDHIDYLCSCIEDLGELEGEAATSKVEPFLEAVFEGKAYPQDRARMWQRKSEPETIQEELRQLKYAAAVGLMRMGKTRPVSYLEACIDGSQPGVDESTRKNLCTKVLRIANPATNSLILAMLELRSEATRDILDKAIVEVGERRLKAAFKPLGDIFWDKAFWGHTKFHAGVSLLELDGKDALNKLLWFLPKYEDDIVKADRWKFVLGQTQFELERWEGSGYIVALDKFDRTRDPRMLPLILKILQPVEVATKGLSADGKKAEEKEEPKAEPKEDTGSTRTRTRGGKGKGEPVDDTPEGPEPTYVARNQFVRARAVEVAARIAGAEVAAVLNQAIDDHREVVRSAAVRAVGEVSGLYKLPVGAKREEELAVRGAALTWLVEQGVRAAPEKK